MSQIVVQQVPKDHIELEAIANKMKSNGSIVLYEEGNKEKMNALMEKHPEADLIFPISNRDENHIPYPILVKADLVLAFGPNGSGTVKSRTGVTDITIKEAFWA